MYNQPSIIGILMSNLGWNRGVRTNQMIEIVGWNDRVKVSQFEGLISIYVFERIIILDKEQKKRALEIAGWLRKMADLYLSRIYLKHNL